MDGQVTVRLYAPFSDAVGRRHLEVPAAQAVPLAEFLAALADSHPALRPYLAEGERHAGSVLPVLNGRFARAEDLIRPGDELLLCAQISGGAPGV
jgi:molybdopterin converting factor small subunit